MSFKEFSELLQTVNSNDQEQLHPIFLLSLQRLLKTLDGNKDALKEIFDSAPGLDIKDFIPSAMRTDEQLMELLDEYQLSFLMPLLSVQQDMAKQLKADPNPASFSKWVQENVEDSFYTQPGFIIALFQVTIKPSDVFKRASFPLILCAVLRRFFNTGSRPYFLT